VCSTSSTIGIIELAQKLDESLAKVSTYPFAFAYLTEFQQVEKNMTKSKRLAGDIVKGLRQLEKVYQRYNATLVRSPELKEAVARLKMYVPFHSFAKSDHELQ